MTLTRDRRTELLAGCALFSGLGADQLAAVAATATEVEFPAGRVIARQGEIGTGFFIVAEGEVRVIRDGALLAALGAGEAFGIRTIAWAGHAQRGDRELELAVDVERGAARRQDRQVRRAG
ncbi:MAG: cyclic nucleotide-binding domain-containing protein [Chloroflexi bacterium]|nr:MAG: cyclic nucleotide-binding domain-containing protein [Chloroflexota bacterium]